MKETRGICDNTVCQICQQEMSFGRIQRHIKSKHKNILIEIDGDYWH